MEVFVMDVTKHHVAESEEEFLERYARRSGVTVEWLKEQGQIVAPCFCGQTGCRGWQVVSASSRDPNMETTIIPAGPRDLGTYFVEVTFANGMGYITDWPTCGYWTVEGKTPLGKESHYPIKLTRAFVSPVYDSDQDVLHSIDVHFKIVNPLTLLSMLREAYQESFDGISAEDLEIKLLRVHKPDGTIAVLRDATT